MKIFITLLSLLALGSVALSAAPAGAGVPATSTAVATINPLSFTMPSAKVSMTSNCIVEDCLIVYWDNYCTCEWVWCNGYLYCGILHEVGGSGTSFASCRVSAPVSIDPKSASVD
ncbi:MAG: hypothetical protein JF614_16235 [Acidobacteria bacterium]|nr:hypothetical protein [Acidobacteriota bacterium]